MNRRNQLAAFAALVLLLIAINFDGFFGSGDAGPVKASEGEGDVIPTIGRVQVPDVALRIDLLEQERVAVQPDSIRNIFAYNIPRPPPPPPKPVPVAEETVELEKAPPPPPTELRSTIPPAPYRFFGIAEGGGAGGRRVFLTDGESIYSAVQGELIDNRYRVVQIGDQNLMLEDTKAGHRWTIPFDTGF